jgi:hypothetical protein
VTCLVLSIFLLRESTYTVLRTCRCYPFMFMNHDACVSQNGDFVFGVSEWRLAKHVVAACFGWAARHASPISMCPVRKQAIACS